MRDILIRIINRFIDNAHHALLSLDPKHARKMHPELWAEVVASYRRLPRAQSRLRHWIARVWRNLPSYPRVWDLLKYLLPRKVRNRAFTPAHEEMMADYYESYAQFRSKWARGWLRFCFGFRTILMLADCYRVLALSKAFDALLKLVPEPLKRWWRAG